MSFLNKYKDRTPEKTVEIIHNFFTLKGYQIIVEELKPTECGTWGCILFLSLNNKKLLTSNGKGVTKEFALASGYAEMFERFSNKIAIYLNAFWGKDVFLKNFDKYGYYISKDEKILKNEDILQQSDLNDWLSSIFTQEEQKKAYIKYLCPISIIGIPYKSYFNEDVKYYDPRLLTRMLTSSGMAAGNTLEEALVQGLNEIFEHYTSNHFFEHLQKTYYRVDKKYLPKELQNIIYEIEKEGNYTFELYDLSYNFNFPVCMSILINKVQMTFHPNFGSAPTFELAAERTITETYQNKYDFLNAEKPQTPFNVDHWAKMYAAGFRTLTTTQTFNEKFFFQEIIEAAPNEKYYFKHSEDISNKDILIQYSNFLRAFNTDFYYYNNSTIDNMFAVQIYCPHLPIKNHEKELFTNLTTEKEKQDFLTCIKNISEFLTALHTENYIFSQDKIHYFFDLMMFNMKHWDFSKFGVLSGSDWLTPLPRPGKPTGHIDIFHVLNRNASLIDTYSNIGTPIYKQTAKYYCTLGSYIQYGMSSDNVIKLMSLWGKTPSNEDMSLYLNKPYLFEKIIVENFIKILKSEEYKFFIESFCN